MKNFFSLLLMSVLIINVTNAQTQVELGIAGDAYYTTDNDEGRGMGYRPLTSTNVFKDRFGTNNVLLHALASNENWKANFSIIANGEGTNVLPEEANVGIRLVEGLWFTGGLFAVWDVNYTFDRWFTGNSLTDYCNMAGPYMAYGLEYNFNNNVTLAAGFMNSNSEGYFEMPNLSKSIYAKLNWNNCYEDWGITLACITGNQADYRETHENITEIYLATGGTIVRKLEGKLSAKVFMYSIDDDNIDNSTAITLQALARYRFNKKFAVGARVSFATDTDGLMDVNGTGLDLGLVWEYNPVPYAYLRVEGGVLSLSNSDNENIAKRFSNNEESTRLGIAISTGFRLGLLQTEIK